MSFVSHGDGWLCCGACLKSSSGSLFPALPMILSSLGWYNACDHVITPPPSYPRLVIMTALSLSPVT